MTNREKYQQAFSVLKASKEIQMEEIPMKKNSVVKTAVAAAAAVAVCFVGSNSICYAATGETWVEKMMVFINGEATETEVNVTNLGNGDYEYSMDVTEDMSSVGMSIVTDENGVDRVGTMETEDVPVFVVEEGKQYLCFGETRTDITEDFSDGEATGEVICESGRYHYVITGTQEEYSISVTQLEN